MNLTIIYKNISLILILLCLPVGVTLSAEADQAIETHIKAFFPEAEQLVRMEAEPPAISALRNGAVIGYAFLSDQVVSIPAYSGKPISTLVAFDVSGKIRGVKIIKHEEPILVIGVKPTDLQRFVNQYQGKHVNERIKLGGRDRAGYVTLDGISGASITAIVLNASIMRSAQKVIQAHNISFAKDADRVATTGKEERAAEPSQGPLWEVYWYDRMPEVIGLLLGLFLLTLILLFQDWLAKRPTLLERLRYAFLAFTLFYIGIYASAQLSVVNVLTFIRAAMQNFQWEAFLIDPILFILWGFVAVTLLLWGRGVYCGWLCPFGALQEFTHYLARALKIPQFELPEVVHDRLWAAKYVFFILLFGLSLQSLEVALPYAEVEPFKTVFALHFQRAWPFVLYVVILLLITLFNRKFFCKYLCPLGAALAIPANLKLFDWLRRRKECGRPCQTCGEECEVRAIRATGEINHHECHYCLDCQVTYYSEYKCPPLVDKRKRMERHRLRQQAGKQESKQVAGHNNSE
jgi:polyferredoxin/Na+-translocating ferredoxin:NAD+ oxidoreductase RnfG subunit